MSAPARRRTASPATIFRVVTGLEPTHGDESPSPPWGRGWTAVPMHFIGRRAGGSTYASLDFRRRQRKPNRAQPRRRRRLPRSLPFPGPTPSLFDPKGRTPRAPRREATWVVPQARNETHGNGASKEAPRPWRGRTVGPLQGPRDYWGANRGRRAQKACPCPRLLSCNPFGVGTAIGTERKRADGWCSFAGPALTKEKGLGRRCQVAFRSEPEKVPETFFFPSLREELRLEIRAHRGFLPK